MTADQHQADSGESSENLEPDSGREVKNPHLTKVPPKIDIKPSWVYITYTTYSKSLDKRKSGK